LAEQLRLNWLTPPRVSLRRSKIDQSGTLVLGQQSATCFLPLIIGAIEARELVQTLNCDQAIKKHKSSSEMISPVAFSLSLENFSVIFLNFTEFK
jgi:hypothetical protein